MGPLKSISLLAKIKVTYMCDLPGPSLAVSALGTVVAVSLLHQCIRHTPGSLVTIPMELSPLKSAFPAFYDLKLLDWGLISMSESVLHISE